MQNAKQGNTTKVLLILSTLINVGLIIALVLLYNSNSDQALEINKLTGEVGEKDSEIISKTKEMEVLRDDLVRIQEERTVLGLENESLNTKIETLNVAITELKNTSRLDSKKRAQLERLISDLRKEIVQKDQEIAKLSLEKDSLSTGLTNLQEEKNRLGDSLNTTANALAYASILKAETFKIVGVKSNGKEMDDPELKGSKIDRLKVDFKIADNKAAKKNKKTFFIALVQPSGEVFSDVANGGGSLTLSDGSDVFYTMGQNLNFDNSNQQLTFTMAKGFNYVPGKYKVIVYSEGYKIGEGGFVVK